jgi:hypothetical protein
MARILECFNLKVKALVLLQQNLVLVRPTRVLSGFFAVPPCLGTERENYIHGHHQSRICSRYRCKFCQAFIVHGSVNKWAELSCLYCTILLRSIVRLHSRICEFPELETGRISIASDGMLGDSGNLLAGSRMTFVYFQR